MSHPETDDLIARLESTISATGAAIVAVSGGVDSTVVAELAHRALGARALAVTADSPALTRRDLREVIDLAKARGWQHRVVQTAELERPGYRQNGADRCFHCKSELFDVLATLPEARTGTVMTGTNVDDLGEHRPGLRAAADHGVVAPLAELGVGKSLVRDIARTLALPTSDRPAAPCLASRIPYGIEVDRDKLNRVERGEQLLRRLGFPVARLRVHQDVARIEVPVESLSLLLEHRQRLLDELHALGFAFVTLDLEGFRSGALNEVLPVIETSITGGR